MKKLLSVFFVFSLALCLTGCPDYGPDEPENGQDYEEISLPEN